MDPERERVLVAGLRCGDPAAFDLVYEEFNRKLFNFLARLARSRDVSDDLLEETWLRLVRHAHRLRPDTRLGPWLFTVARNLHVSYCRSRQLERSLADDLIGLWPETPRQPSPFEEAARTEAERRVEHALAALPAIYREVLLLVGFAGLSPAEAASVCGLAPEALRQRLSRGRAMLAKALEIAERGPAIAGSGNGHDQ